MTASQYQSVLTMTDKDLLSSVQSSQVWISIYPAHTSPHFVIAVPFTRVGHCDTRGQESDQSDVNRQPGQEDQVGRGTKAPMDLRKSNLHNSRLPLNIYL